MINEVTALKNVPVRFVMEELQCNLYFAVQERIEYNVLSERGKDSSKRLCRALNTGIK